MTAKRRHPEPDTLGILTRHSACREAVDWVRESKLSASDMWRTCEQGDWMLWIAAKLGVDRKLVVLAACDCAETALKFVPEGEDRPRKAIETARAWCRGEATIKEVRNAAANAADAADYAAYAAAAYAAAYAASAAASAAAAYAAAYAAAAAASAASAAYAAYAAARQEALKHIAALVRKRIPWRVIKSQIARVS